MRIAARLSRAMWESGMLEFETMIFDTIATDTRLRELAHQAVQGKRQDSETVFDILFPPEVLRADVSKDEAIDLILAIDSAPVVRRLIEDLGWSYEQYERWLVHIPERLFLEDTMLTIIESHQSRSLNFTHNGMALSFGGCLR